MPQPHKLSDYIEFLPKKEPRRNPLPITSLPVNSISQDSDPTLEIRTLIEQLQQTARDAREQARAVERDRDALAVELSSAQQEIEALQHTERELRSHFVEVTALIRERDAAREEAARRAQALADATRKNEIAVRERNDAQHEREEAARQRDEAARKFATAHRASEEQGRIIADTQKQLQAIRQARDAAHVQLVEMNNRLGATEDRLAELGYQYESAQKNAKQAAVDAMEFRRQLEIVSADRDATVKQVENLSGELDAQRQKYLDLAAEKTAALAEDGEQLAALAEARAQVDQLSAERDAARSRLQEQTRELEELRAQFQAFRDEADLNSDVALNEAQEKIAALEAQARVARQEENNLRQQLNAFAEQLAGLQSTAEEAAAHDVGSRAQVEALEIEHAAALASLSAAQQQIDHLVRERDQVRAQATENAQALESELCALKAQVSALAQSAGETAVRQEELANLNARYEKRRLETIDLATQLQGAQREVRELSASLAEARLQVKFANATSRAARDGRTKDDFATLLHESGAPASAPEAGNAPGIAEAAPESDPVPAPAVTEPLTEKEAKGALAAMRGCFQAFTKKPADFSLLNELHCHVEGFSERARVTGLIALHRISSVFSDLTRGLYENPDQVNPSTLRTVQQTIEFLATLMREKDLAQIKDPARATIYAVDDDLGNCESIALAMEESMMRTTYAQEPALALAELAASRYDLILLDVNLPGMDGFELCRKIRCLPNHTATPIVFLTGLATLENRVQSSLCGGNDFVAKPFNLHELSVKAITLILQAQLQDISGS